jgi:hypothetical protein
LADALGMEYKRHSSYIQTGNAQGDKGNSLTISDNGLWHDHATGEGGDLIELIRLNQGFEHPHEALNWASEFLGISESHDPRRPARDKRIVPPALGPKGNAGGDLEFLPLGPGRKPFAPENIINKDGGGFKQRSPWTYGPLPYFHMRDITPEGGIVPSFYFTRTDWADGGGKKGKSCLYWSYAKNNFGQTGWANIGPSPEFGARPLLGIEQLLLHPTRPKKFALLVEGEKAYCHVLRHHELVRELLAGTLNGEGFFVFTWSGGGSYAKTDFAPLNEFPHIILSPDNDTAGRKNMEAIERIILRNQADAGIQTQAKIQTVTFPGMKEKDDLADIIGRIIDKEGQTQ